MDLMHALVLGILEGVTEFLPVSSTGHLLLAGHFMGFQSPGRSFEVLIQLGAILAIMTVYFAKLWHVASTFHQSAASRRFVFSVLIAFMPAVVIGLALHGFIKSVLFETPALICVMLLLGGFVLLWVDRLPLKPVYKKADALPYAVALKIGLMQCLAMVPGVSRSGATIVGGLLLGADKRTAAEFSFFLAMPTMAAAFFLDVLKNWDALQGDVMTPVVVGFAAAFVSAVVVVRYALDYINSHGFWVFAWWRIVVGTAGLVALAVVG